MIICERSLPMFIIYTMVRLRFKMIQRDFVWVDGDLDKNSHPVTRLQYIKIKA